MGGCQLMRKVMLSVAVTLLLMQRGQLPYKAVMRGTPPARDYAPDNMQTKRQRVEEGSRNAALLTRLFIGMPPDPITPAFDAQKPPCPSHLCTTS
jgi:hypothetical protein